jgi:hypothetical protein
MRAFLKGQNLKPGFLASPLGSRAHARGVAADDDQSFFSHVSWSSWKKGKKIGTQINLAQRSRNQKKVPEVKRTMLPVPVSGCPVKPKTGNRQLGTGNGFFRQSEIYPSPSPWAKAATLTRFPR